MTISSVCPGRSGNAAGVRRGAGPRATPARPCIVRATASATQRVLSTDMCPPGVRRPDHDRVWHAVTEEAAGVDLAAAPIGSTTEKRFGVHNDVAPGRAPRDPPTLVKCFH